MQELVDDGVECLLIISTNNYEFIVVGFSISKQFLDSISLLVSVGLHGDVDIQ